MREGRGQGSPEALLISPDTLQLDIVLYSAGIAAAAAATNENESKYIHRERRRSSKKNGDNNNNNLISVCLAVSFFLCLFVCLFVYVCLYLFYFPALSTGWGAGNSERGEGVRGSWVDLLRLKNT